MSALQEGFLEGDLCLIREAKRVVFLVTTVSVLRKGSFLKRYLS